MLLLHGFPEFWWAWRKQANVLAAAGFRVLMLDLRGYGRSDAPPSVSSYRLPLLVEDIAAFASELGWKQFSLVGHDWGGIIAWAVAAWHPDMIKRLVVLNAPHLDVMPKVLRKTPLQVVCSAYVGFFRLPFLPEFFLSLGDFRMLRFALISTSRRGTFGSDAIERYASEWKRPGRLSAMLNYYRALTREKRVALGRIVPPVLILWGRRDHALSFPLASESLLQCVDGRILTQRHATHWIHIEEPEWVNENIVRFLSFDHARDGAPDQTAVVERSGHSG
ncbi:alpha/beta hydrolase [Rhizobium laguerreae]|nr:alpha/beta hydrolase [Rhizobium laguerreae]